MKQEIKKRSIRRLRIIQGQLNGLLRMVEQEEYCIDIMVQSSAVKAAISSVEEMILENHLSTHVLEHIKHGKEKEAIAEILKVYKLAQKKQ